MIPPLHDRNCAVYRLGDIRAWCDCGIEPPVMAELRAKAILQEGKSRERVAIVRLIRDSADDIIGKACAGRADPIETELITLTLETLAEMIEEGAHHDTDA